VNFQATPNNPNRSTKLAQMVTSSTQTPLRHPASHLSSLTVYWLLLIPDCVWSSRTVFGHPGLRSGIQCIHQSLRGGLKTGPRVKPGVTVIGARVTVICHPALGLRHPGLRSGIQSPFCHPGLRSGIQCIHQLLRNSSKTGPRVKPGVTVSGARVDRDSSSRTRCGIQPPRFLNFTNIHSNRFFESKN
jgi:hypothetical protein